MADEVNINQARRVAFMHYPETAFREAVYALAKSLQSQGMTIPQRLQDYVDFCDRVKRDHPKPEQSDDR